MQSISPDTNIFFKDFIVTALFDSDYCISVLNLFSVNYIHEILGFASIKTNRRKAECEKVETVKPKIEVGCTFWLKG